MVGRLYDLRDPEAYDLFGQLFEAGIVNELSDDQMAWAAPQIHCLSTTCHLRHGGPRTNATGASAALSPPK